MIVLFWCLIFLVFYTFLGYGILLFTIVKIKGKTTDPTIPTHELPNVVHLIAAYNEEKDIEAKIKNSLGLDYPSDKYQVWIVTDGSDDRTKEIVQRYPQVRLFHQDERKGKIHAVNRVMPSVDAEITVFSDANTHLNPEAILKLINHYKQSKTGGVSGEKRILMEVADEAVSSGEGIYWKYESFLKKYDYQLYSVVGAAGELFSIRTSLYEQIPSDTLIEDFYLTLKIAMKGFRIAYEPDAYAVEKSSLSVEEEAKRKVRIAAGGLQAIWRLRGLFNLFKYGWLSFQFVSHRVLRWTLTPLALPLIFFVNIQLALTYGYLYAALLLGQLIFYLMAFMGWIFQKKKIKMKIFFIPYYFLFMNWSVYLGFIRLIKGRQSVLWERAGRK